MDIEDDEVEQEFDIVYSGEYSNDVKIFQFPLVQENSMNIEDINSLNVSQNMKTMKMEIKIDDKYFDKNNYNDTPIQTLKGEKIENNSNLCLGIMKNNKLILSPISQIFQFRHDFSNISKDKLIKKIKNDKKEVKNILKKEDKDDNNFIPLTVHQPNSIDSNIVLEKMTSDDEMLGEADFMSKDEYFNLLLKYVITPDTSGDSNDELISFAKNNFSKELLEIKEVKNDDEEMDMNKSNNKPKNFNSGIEAIKSEKMEVDSGNGIVINMINKIFEKNECIFYDNLLNDICVQFGLNANNKDKIELIKKEIEKKCIIVKNNICFIRDEDGDNKDVRNILVKEIGNNENGLKKQQIKKIIEQNNINISDNKLTKILQKICKYTGNSWSIKIPNNK